MDVVIAKSAGFCFGVKRAIDKTYDLLDNCDGVVYSIGPIIHNELVVAELREKGLREIDDEVNIKSLKNETVVVRTHGIEKKLYDLLIKNGNKVIDLTCPFVRKIHETVKKYSDLGYKIVVIGDKNHPEVRGIVSYGKEVAVLLDKSDIDGIKFAQNSNILVVFQTTMNATKAQKLVDILKEFYYNIKVVDTICNATIIRQEEVETLAKVCDVMLIIGSANSSNTMKLYDISKNYCDNSYLIETAECLKKISINKNLKVGVSAGASTPLYLIEEILKNVRNEF